MRFFFIHENPGLSDQNLDTMRGEWFSHAKGTIRSDYEER